MHPIVRYAFCTVVVAWALGVSPSRVGAIPPGPRRILPAPGMGSPAPAEVRSATLRPSDGPERVGYNALGVTLLGRVPISDLGSWTNDVWGYVSPQGREYAIVGLQVGTGFVDVTDPSVPEIVAIIPDARSTWSDMAVYQEYAYNVNESGGGMQVINLAQIDEGIVTLVRAVTGGLGHAHNVFLNPESGYVYPCGTNIASGGFVAYSLADPSDPQYAGEWDDNYAHDLYVVNYDDCPYAGRSGECEIAFVFGGGGGLLIVDVTDKSNMQTISTLSYPNLAYCHQGWLTEDRRYLLVGDEADEGRYGLTTRTIVVDVQDLGNPQYVRSFTNGLPSIDHNILVRGDFAFEANYSSGLRIYDVSDVFTAHEVGYFDTYPPNDGRSFMGAWGVYPHLPSGVVLISDQSGGLFVLDALDAVGCSADSHCNDHNPCTTDTCGVTGECANSLVSSGTPCDDGDVCTINGQCDAGGACIGTNINTISCTDDGPCSPGTCDTETSLCVCYPCETVASPRVETPVAVAKNRYVSFGPSNPGQLTAWRVTLTASTEYPAAVGLQWWVGQPREVCENSGKGLETPAGECPDAVPSKTFWAAPVQCTPVFRDWGSIDLLHAWGEAIVPGATYIIQAVSQGCYDAGVSRYSTPLTATQAKWGDVCGPDQTGVCTTPPDGIADVTNDVLGVLLKFQNDGGAMMKVAGDIEPGLLDLKVNVANDVLYVLGAFRGGSYPFSGPQSCP